MFNPFIIRRILTLIILSYIFFFLGNSIVALTDPDEVFYSLTAKEMAEHHSWLVPYIFHEPQFEKPILSFWLFRAAFELWGITPFSARFFPALFAVLGVLGVYFFGLIGFKNERKAFWSALVLASGGLFLGMAKTVFTDMFFAVFILYAMLFFYATTLYPGFKKKGILLFFIFIALGVLTKGPLALTIGEMTIILFLLYVQKLDFIKTIWMPLGVCICLAIALPWYIYMYQHYGQAFIQEFFYNDHWRRFIEAEHKSNDRWFFYPLTIVLGLFPWSLFTALSFVNLYKKLKTSLLTFEYFLLSWIIVVFVTFQFAHSKLASYILPLFPAIALLTGSCIIELIEKREASKLLRIFILIMSGFFFVLGVGVILAHPLYARYIPDIQPIYFISGSLIAIACMAVVFLLRLEYAKSLGMFIMVPGILLWSLFMLKNDIEPYISTYSSAQYIPTIPQGTQILTIKPYARGIRFFTQEDVTVIDINGGNYFSRHPISILTKENEVHDFLKKQRLTYAVLKKGAVTTIMNLPKNAFKVTVLKQVGYNFIVKIEAI